MKCYVISLKECPERWEKVEKHLREYGFEPERFEAIKHEIGSYGCSLSHNAIIEMAKKQKLKNIVVFEDDVFFLHPKKYVHSQIKKMLRMKSDVIYIGANFAWECEFERIKEDIINIKKCLGRFAVIYKASAYDYLLKSMPTLDEFKARREVRGDVLLGNSDLKKIGCCLAAVDSSVSYTGTNCQKIDEPLKSGCEHFSLIVGAYLENGLIDPKSEHIKKVFEKPKGIYDKKIENIAKKSCNPFNLIDGILYINMQKDKERKEKIEKEFEKYGINTERFHAIENKNGWAGSTLSHRACIALAKERGWKRVLIFEDDIFFIKPALDVYADLKQALEHDFDILYLGLTVDSPQKRIGKNYWKAEKGWGLYAYVVDHTAYDKILDLIPENPEEISQEKRTVSDILVYDHIQPLGNCKMIAVCSAMDGFSHNWQTQRKGLADKIVSGYKRNLEGFEVLDDSISKFVITKGGQRISDFRKQKIGAKEIAPIWGTPEIQKAVDDAKENGITDEKKLLKIAQEASNRLTFSSILKNTKTTHTAIFEDDCELLCNVDKIELPEDYDIFLIGCYFRGGELEKKGEFCLIKSGKIWGCHAIIVSKRFAEKMADDLEGTDFITDKYVSSLIGSAKIYMAQMAWQKSYENAVHRVDLQRARKHSEEQVKIAMEEKK